MPQTSPMLWLFFFFFFLMIFLILCVFLSFLMNLDSSIVVCEGEKQMFYFNHLW